MDNELSAAIQSLLISRCFYSEDLKKQISTLIRLSGRKNKVKSLIAGI